MGDALTADGAWPHLPEFGKREPGVVYEPRPGAYAVILDAHARVAVIDTPQGLGLPGGGADPGETPEETLAREAREECGHGLADLHRLGEAVQFVFVPEDGRHYRKHGTFYAAALGPRLGDPLEKDHTLLWLPAPEAAARLATESQAWVVERVAAAQARNDPAALTLTPARVPEDLPVVRELLREYEKSLGAEGVDLCFQGFEAELSGLPGPYAPPTGALLVARDRGGVGGCVALRRLEDGVCEMKRLYVRPSHRGLGLGRRLAEAVLDEARRLGYRTIRLDTLPFLTSAIALYRQMGFREIPPYHPDPLVETLYFERMLDRP